MASNSETIEKLKRRLMESWSTCDDNETSNLDTSTNMMGMKSEPMSPVNFTWQEIKSAKHSPVRNSPARNSPVRNSPGEGRAGGGGSFKLTPSGKSLGK